MGAYGVVTTLSLLNQDLSYLLDADRLLFRVMFPRLIALTPNTILSFQMVVSWRYQLKLAFPRYGKKTCLTQLFNTNINVAEPATSDTTVQ